MKSRLVYTTTVITMSVPALAACGADPAPLSDHSLTELCERPEQLLEEVWHFAEPVVGIPNTPATDHTDTIGAGGHCRFEVDRGQIAVLSLIRDTPGMGDPPRDAHSVRAGDHIVKTWTVDPTTVTFEAVISGWEASITVTPGSDLATGEPAAEDAQIEATATELVEILAEFRGPDHTPTQY